jgi:predicted regulator of Ras-like GTPase activity (Roadblock/LC7/MglB family)
VTTNGVGEPQLESPVTGRDFRHLLADLTALEHVRGGLLVAPDGLVIATTLPPEVPVEPVSALAATLGRELELRVPAARQGTFIMGHFVADDGTVFIGATPIGFIVLLTDTRVNRDAIRHALRETIAAIRHAWPH